VSVSIPIHVPRYGVFTCKTCLMSDNGICGDHCSTSWVDELPPNWLDEFWPVCSCCGSLASLMEPLIPV
jgi:hypothetical protein